MPKVKNFVTALLLLLFNISCVHSLQAENNALNPIEIKQFNSIENPQICHGFQGEWGIEQIKCPLQTVILSAVLAHHGSSPTADHISLYPQCCSLPRADILSKEEIFSSIKCPDQFVATGVDFPSNCKDCSSNLHCTKINTQRYQLGIRLPGAYWGFGSAYWKHKFQIFRRDIPVAIRDGVGRINKFFWHTQGCIGYPFGSILVGKESKRCHDITFRQLQYRGLSGDPAKGTPVTMFPKCDQISDKYSKNPQCLVF